MTWLTRNGRKSYHRFRRVNGKVIHTYVGTGRVAQLAAEADELQRQQRQLARDERDRHIAAVRQEYREQHQLDSFVEHFLRAQLRCAGFYLWNRCVWRKRDMNPKYNPQAHRTAKPLPPKQPPAAEQAVSRPRTIQEELQRLSDAANKGDPASLHQLRQFLANIHGLPTTAVT